MRERHELCDLFERLGPDAPTLSGEWTTHDLAAHLVVRERDPLAGPGILISAFAGLTESRMARAKAKHTYAELVALVRTGPPFGPMKPAPIRYMANMVEYFVHHEDVRRPAGEGPRTDRTDLDDALWSLLSRMAPLMLRSSGVEGVELRLLADDGRERRVGKGDLVTIAGGVQELVLELYGRSTVAQVRFEGDDAAVERVRSGNFGI